MLDVVRRTAAHARRPALARAGPPRLQAEVLRRSARARRGLSSRHVWAWLIGPFVDAWLKVHPERRATAPRACCDGLTTTSDEACVGSISEIFDAEPPYTPRGCIAQAWSVAEVLRCLIKTAPHDSNGNHQAAAGEVPLVGAPVAYNEINGTGSKNACCSRMLAGPRNDVYCVKNRINT